MSCDLCGKVGEPLIPLRDGYSTKDIKDICSDCAYKCNNHLDKLREVSAVWYKKVFNLWLKNEKATKVTI